MLLLVGKEASEEQEYEQAIYKCLKLHKQQH